MTAHGGWELREDNDVDGGNVAVTMRFAIDGERMEAWRGGLKALGLLSDEIGSIHSWDRVGSSGTNDVAGRRIRSGGLVLAK